MKVIPLTLVKTVWTETGQKTLDELLLIKENFQKNQPQLYQFLVKFTDHISIEAKELTFYYSQIIWQIFQKAYNQILPEISQDEIYSCIDEREQWLEKISDPNYQKIEQFITNNVTINQANILSHSLETVLKEDEDNLELNNEDQAYFLWLLIIVVDTLDHATS